MMQMLLDWTDDLDEFEMISEEFHDVGDDRVIARVHQSATGSRSGAPIEADFWFLYEFSGGMIVRLVMYASRSQASRPPGFRAEARGPTTLPRRC